MLQRLALPTSKDLDDEAAGPVKLEDGALVSSCQHDLSYLFCLRGEHSDAAPPAPAASRHHLA
jgi:hypothetical protein